MIRLGRLILWLMLLGSVGLMLRAGVQIADNPALSPVTDRASDQIAAEVDRLLARDATPERLTSLIQTRLADQPRNWVALQALADLAAERGVPLPAGYAEAWDEDSGVFAAVSDCGACIWDIATCTLSTALICKAPILLTPAEDLRGVDDLTALLRPDVLRPMAATLTDLGRIGEATGPVQALHLLPLVDDATDARRLARVAEAMGPRTVAGAEVLGKSRLLRASLRYGDEAIGAIIGLVGAVVSAAMMAAGAVQSLLLRRLRRALS